MRPLLAPDMKSPDSTTVRFRVRPFVFLFIFFPTNVIAPTRASLTKLEIHLSYNSVSAKARPAPRRKWMTGAVKGREREMLNY